MENEQTAITDELGVEWLILADYAEAVAGKLYLMGGGWDQINVNGEFPMQKNFAIALAIKVPWYQTNRPHTFELVFEDADGQLLGNAPGQFETGRPVGIPAGKTQRAQVAIVAGMQFERPGEYVVRALLNGEESARTSFGVVKAS
jgi:hypothetical protein